MSLHNSTVENPQLQVGQHLNSIDRAYIFQVQVNIEINLKCF